MSDLSKQLAEPEKYFGDQQQVTLTYGKGCDGCNHSGFKGRSAIYEIIGISPALKQLIMKNPSSDEIWNLAKQEGAKTLFEDGIEKVKSGRTTLEELMRVAEPK